MNDCGVFMSCIAALYIKGLIKEKRLPAKSNASETIFADVRVSTHFNSTDIGWAARDHMMKTLRTGQCNHEDSFFD
jgi:hypothetical protein